ncbi:sperm-associated antigen 6-like [Daktulosphaira vitifoliae]|uniref:sperm-associated antigen 6-like n=1 Tax=Daktulosphaira vitifoliae TaxID=58002 RepID=UPI0021AA0EE5|nr:sperm-associated antigen 6-like [Daktulosphaira vitifoliae]
MNSPKAVARVVENFNKSKLNFVQSLADLASREAHVECLRINLVIQLVSPLVTDPNPTIRTNLILLFSRMVGHSEASAKDILKSPHTITQIFECIIKENKYYKKNSMDFIKNICKHSSSIAIPVITKYGGVSAIMICMDDFDLLVRESALQAISSVARHGPEPVVMLVNAGVLSHITICLKEQHVNLKLAALVALESIAKLNPDMAQEIVESSSLPFVISLLEQPCINIKIQRNALTLIRSIVKHSLSLAENAIEADLFPSVLHLMAHPDELTRTHAAQVVSELVKHSVQIAQLVVNAGGIASLMNVIKLSKECSPNSAILAIGFISAMSTLLARVVIQSEVLLLFDNVLESNVGDITKADVVWAIGMIGQHSTEHSREVCARKALCFMIDTVKDSKSGPEIKSKCMNALILVLEKCDNLTTLNNLLNLSTPTAIIKCILNQFIKILSKNAKARRNFIENDNLKMIQELMKIPDSELHKSVQSINCFFPGDIVQIVSGNLPESVMQKVDSYQPKSQCIFYNRSQKSEISNLDNTSFDGELANE